MMEVPSATFDAAPASDVPAVPAEARRVFFGHHKCATSWISRILREICYRLGRTFEVVHREVDYATYESLGAYADAQGADVLAYTNAKADVARDLPFARGFHVVRDPRDVLVSAYFSHKHSHPTTDWPELAEHRKVLQSLPKREGLMEEMAFSAERFADMADWDYDRDDVLEVKLETLSPEPVQGFIEIADFLGLLEYTPEESMERTMKQAGMALNRVLYKGRHVLPSRNGAPTISTWSNIPVTVLRNVVRKNSFESLSGGREKGEEDVTSHYRKGVPGDWKNHFEPVHVREFKDRFGGLVCDLGYAEDADWDVEGEPGDSDARNRSGQ